MNQLSIIEQLEQTPDAFDFFYAIFLLEFNSDKQPLGCGNQPAEESVQLLLRSDLSFNANQLVRCLTDREKNVRLEVSGFGLTGSEGVLPLHYSEQINRQNRQKNTALQDYFNILNHRSLSLFYRAWEKYRFPIQYTRAKRQAKKPQTFNPDFAALPKQTNLAQEDSFTRILKSLLGMNSSASTETLPENAVLYYAGIMSRQQRSATDIQQILADYFNLPVTVESFSGQWERLPVISQTQLPNTDRPQGLNNELGGNMILGQQAWSIQNKIAITFRCDSYETFEDFSLNGSGFDACRTLLGLLAGPNMSVALRLEVTQEVMPSLQLCGRSSDTPARLGFNTLVKHESVGTEDQSTSKTPLQIQLPLM